LGVKELARVGRAVFEESLEADRASTRFWGDEHERCSVGLLLGVLVDDAGGAAWGRPEVVEEVKVAPTADDGSVGVHSVQKQTAVFLS